MENQHCTSLVGQSARLVNADKQPARKRGYLIKYLIVFVGISALVVCGTVLLQAWRETTRREAYLDQLAIDSKQHDTDGRLLALLGGRLVQAGKYPEAAETLKRALAAGEQTDLIWLNLAAATAASGETKRALADVQLGERALPKSPDLYRTLIQVQELGPSASPLIVAHTISPQGPDSLVRLYTSGSFLNPLVQAWGLRHPEESGYTTREHWVAREPKNPEAQRLWGLALVRNGRFPEAGAALTRAVYLAPNSAETHLALAGWLSAEGQGAKAILAYMDCLKLKPKWLPALLGIGKGALDTGLDGYAIGSFGQATRSYPDSADAWVGLGRAYRKTGVDQDKAIAAFQHAARLAPLRTDYYDDYSDALRQGVRWSEAEALLRKRLQQAPDDALGHCLLGEVLLNNLPTADRQVEAEAQTREALRLSPHNPLASLQLAQILLAGRHLNEAIDLLMDALQSDPSNRNVMTVLARAYRQSGHLDLAEKVSKQADLLFANQQRIQILEDQEAKNMMNISAHQELAVLYDKLGKSRKAMNEESIVQLIRHDPKKAEQELVNFKAARDAVLPAQ